jgi:hypothetical protein
LVRGPRDAPLPVSFAQEAILSYCQTPDDSARNVLVRTCKIIGPLDVTVLRDCLNYVVSRHEILRTTFSFLHGQPAQIVHRAEPILLSILQGDSEGNPTKEAERIIEEETLRVLDPTQGPLIRFSLLRFDYKTHWFFVICHHLLADARSIRLFFKEVVLLYEARFEGRPPPLPECEPLQYADYAYWQREILRRDGSDYQEAIDWWMGHFQVKAVRHLRWALRILRSDGSRLAQRAIAWWKKHLQRKPPQLELPFKRPRLLPGLDPSEGIVDWPVDLELEERLDLLSRRSGSSLFSIWLAALSALLAIETAYSDIIIGTYVTSRRGDPNLRNLFGCFANLVALRFQCDPARLFSDWLSEVRSLVGAAKARCEITHKEISNLVQGLGGTPPELQLIFHAPMGVRRVEDMQFADLELVGSDLHIRTRMPWGFSIELHKSDLQICGAYFNAEIYDPVGVRSFLRRLCELLNAITLHPDVPIERLVARHADSEHTGHLNLSFKSRARCRRSDSPMKPA